MNEPYQFNDCKVELGRYVKIWLIIFKKLEKNDMNKFFPLFPPQLFSIGKEFLYLGLQYRCVENQLERCKKTQARRNAGGTAGIRPRLLTRLASLVDDLTKEVPSAAPEIFVSRMKICQAQEPYEMKNALKTPLHELPCRGPSINYVV